MSRRGCCIAVLLLLMSVPIRPQSPAPAEPLRLGMAGLVHGHASGFLTRYLKRPDVTLVGIAEPDQSVASRYRERFSLDPSMLFSSVERMLDQARPQAVVRKEIKPGGLSSLENNLVVTEILDAARRSAATGKRVVFQ
jgi:hypothetical protein